MLKKIFWLMVVEVFFLYGVLVHAAVYKDDFNRSDQELRASPEWDFAHGAYYGYQIKDNKLVSVYDSPLGVGGLNAQAFVGALYKGETYQRISIDFLFPDIGSNEGTPEITLCLNLTNPEAPWGDMPADDYRITLRGIKDLAVRKYKSDGKEEFTSGWIPYTQGSLKTKTWYRLTLEKKEKIITGNVKTLEGVLIGGGQIVDEGTEYKEGRPVILTRYTSEAPSIELDNFEYEIEGKAVSEPVKSTETPKKEDVVPPSEP